MPIKLRKSKGACSRPALDFGPMNLHDATFAQGAGDATTPRAATQPRANAVFGASGGRRGVQPVMLSHDTGNGCPSRRRRRVFAGSAARGVERASNAHHVSAIFCGGGRQCCTE